MKLYRAIQPDEIHNNDKVIQIDGLWYKLEPIEITEEEIVEILRGPRIGGDSILFNDEAEFLAKAILSKLKGDEQK